MNKEILKINILAVVSQPCRHPDHVWNPKDILENGLSEDGTHICLKVRPDDAYSCIYIHEEDFVDQILEKMPPEYRDHLVTIRHSDWISYSYWPVFDTDTQAQFDEEKRKYIRDKAEWCRKYGSN
ncbi:MAG: hypothetical protein J5545_00050 [Bacteroidaceae bacterium]|nr:hypothetical protein [Bacteroidaceae bacterium]